MDEACEQRGCLKEKWERKAYSERQLIFLEHIMKEEGQENATLMRHIVSKTDKGKRRLTCLTSFCKLMTDQGVIIGERYSEQELVESHDHRCPEGSQRRELDEQSINIDIQV